MSTLSDFIARLEIQIEQWVIHLRGLDRNGPEADRDRRRLLNMLLELRNYKERREDAAAQATITTAPAFT